MSDEITFEQFKEWWLEHRVKRLHEIAENAYLNGYLDSKTDNINILSQDHSKVGRYTLLMSHGLPSRRVEHFVFNRRVKRG